AGRGTASELDDAHPWIQRPSGRADLSGIDDRRLVRAGPVRGRLVLGRRVDHDVVDPPLVVLLAEHDPEPDAVLVPAQLGAIRPDLLDLPVAPLVQAGDEALDLTRDAVPAARGEQRQRAGEILVVQRVRELADRVARRGRARAPDQRLLEPPRAAVALE